MSKRLLPPSRIGIIGGGQLALYMAIDALQMGYKVSTYDPDSKAPAQRVSDFTCGSFDDIDALEHFASQCDVLTYEFENMNLDHIETLDKKFNLPQGSKILKHTAHRYQELLMAQSLDIPTVHSVYLESNEADRSDLNKLQLPLIVKTARFGYDGKGQQLIHHLDDIEIEVESLVSEYIQFDYEISVILVRCGDEIQWYPHFRNKHKKGVLYHTDTLDEMVYEVGFEYARKIAIAMDYQGLLAVEFFVKDGGLIFNEVAPRPHNSGHLTLSVSNKSQFKAHIEAICNLEVGPLYHTEDALMMNLLGEEVVKSRETMHQANIDHYEYGKEDIKPGRKMGHDVYTKEAMRQKVRELQDA